MYIETVSQIFGAITCDKNYLMCAEIHEESFKAYRMKLSSLEQKILKNIQLGVNCADVL